MKTNAIHVLIFGGLLVATAGSAAVPKSQGAILPIVPLTVQTTTSGEVVELALHQDGTLHLRVAPATQATLVGRISGATIVRPNGQVLVAVGNHGELRILGHEQQTYLRTHSLLDCQGKNHHEEDEEYTIHAGGGIFRRRGHAEPLGLPAGVIGDFNRAGGTALLLYRIWPFLWDHQIITEVPNSLRDHLNHLLGMLFVW